MEETLPPTLPFEYAIRSTAQGEPWTRLDIRNGKFYQYGWRSDKHDDYKDPRVLLGNWRERSFSDNDVKNMSPLKSQFGNYFKTTYQSDYSRPNIEPKFSRGCKGHYAGAYPNFQPVEDFQSRQDTFKTIYKNAYEHQCSDKKPSKLLLHDRNSSLK